MNEFSQVQLRTFRTFLTFSFLVLFTSLSIMVSNSQKFRISEIDYVLDNELEFQSLNLLYGKSIWFVDENSFDQVYNCLLYTSPSPRDGLLSRMPSSA